MTDKTEAQPEALRLAAWLNEGVWHQMRLGDVLAAGRELRRQHAEIQQLKAREHELVQLHDHSNLVVDAAKERIASLATELRETNEMNQQLRDQNTAVDAACAALEKTGIEAANRAAAAEQQVAALTQRLDMANRLNTDARNQLAQLSARQAAPDGWRLLPVEPTVAQINAAHARGFFRALSIPLYDAMLSAAPPPPEREPLSDEQIFDIAESFKSQYTHGGVTFDEFDYLGFAREIQRAHGIGATND